jgi:hypothetical protein
MGQSPLHRQLNKVAAEELSEGPLGPAQSSRQPRFPARPRPGGANVGTVVDTCP